MAINHSPLINAFVGGLPIQIVVNVFSGPNGENPDSALPLNIGGTEQVLPGIGTLTLHPTNPRAVIFTPAATGAGGSSSFNVSTTPSADDPLSIDVSVSVAPSKIRVTYQSHGPVQP